MTALLGPLPERATLAGFPPIPVAGRLATITESTATRWPLAEPAVRAAASIPATRPIAAALGSGRAVSETPTLTTTLVVTTAPRPKAATISGLTPLTARFPPAARAGFTAVPVVAPASGIALTAESTALTPILIPTSIAGTLAPACGTTRPLEPTAIPLAAEPAAFAPVLVTTAAGPPVSEVPAITTGTTRVPAVAETSAAFALAVTAAPAIRKTTARRTTSVIATVAAPRGSSILPLATVATASVIATVAAPRGSSILPLATVATAIPAAVTLATETTTIPAAVTLTPVPTTTLAAVAAASKTTSVRTTGALTTEPAVALAATVRAAFATVVGTATVLALTSVRAGVALAPVATGVGSAAKLAGLSPVGEAGAARLTAITVVSGIASWGAAALATVRVVSATEAGIPPVSEAVLKTAATLA